MANGDFADGLTDWDTTTNVGPETSNVHSIPGAAQLGVPPNQNEPATLAQVIDDFDTSCCYVMDFFIDGSGNMPVTASVLVGETTVASVTVPNTTQSGFRYYRVFVPCTTEEGEALVVFNKPGTGAIFIDDVGLHAVGPCPENGA